MSSPSRCLRSRVHISSTTCAAWLTMNTVPASRRSCVILFLLRSLNEVSPVESASSMRRMFGFAAATITKRRCDDILDEEVLVGW